MKSALVPITLGLSLMAGSALAQSTTYQFTGAPFNTAIRTSNCQAPGVGDCTPYALGDKVVISLTFSEPLAPNLPLADQGATLTAYSYNDGHNTVTGPKVTSSVEAIKIGTDAAGIPTTYQIEIQSFPSSTFTISDQLDPNSRMNGVAIFHNRSAAWANYICNGRASTSTASSAGNCLTYVSPNPADRSSFYQATGPSTVIKYAPIPTLSEWSMILLTGLLAAGSSLLLWRRHRAA